MIRLTSAGCAATLLAPPNSLLLQTLCFPTASTELGPETERVEATAAIYRRLFSWLDLPHAGAKFLRKRIPKLIERTKQAQAMSAESIIESKQIDRK